LERQQLQIGRRLEALLDERDHLRIKLSLAQDRVAPGSEEIVAMRKQLIELEKTINQSWKNPNS